MSLATASTSLGGQHQQVVVRGCPGGSVPPTTPHVLVPAVPDPSPVLVPEGPAAATAPHPRLRPHLRWPMMALWVSGWEKPVTNRSTTE